MGVGVEEIVCERFKAVIVQVELELERAIGHAATALEHCHHLIQHLLEGHGHPSTTLARVPRESTMRQEGVSSLPANELGGRR